MIASIDDAVVLWVTAHRWHPLDGFFVALGTIEKLGAVWVALALVGTLVLRQGALCALLRALVVGLTAFAADAVSFGVKDLTHRPRPFVAHPEIHPLYSVHSSSFPAGHAATAFAGATLLSYVWRRGLPGFVVLAAAIGFSRVYDGVHYPGDVLAGAAVGVLTAAFVVVLVGRTRLARVLAPSPGAGAIRPGRQDP